MRRIFSQQSFRPSTGFPVNLRCFFSPSLTPPLTLTSPVAIDIGGTNAKIAFIVPVDTELLVSQDTSCSGGSRRNRSASKDSILSPSRSSGSKGSLEAADRSDMSNTNVRSIVLPPRCAVEPIGDIASVLRHLIDVRQILARKTTEEAKTILRFVTCPTDKVFELLSTIASPTTQAENDKRAGKKAREPELLTLGSLYHPPALPTVTGNTVTDQRAEKKSGQKSSTKSLAPSIEAENTGEQLDDTKNTFLSSSSSSCSNHFVLSEIPATGGGAYRMKKEVKKQFGLTFNPLQEMDCLVHGLCFLLLHCRDRCFFTFDFEKGEEMDHQLNLSLPSTPLDDATASQPLPLKANETVPLFPACLLVNIGSGVSFLKVSGPDNYVRVGGSPMGGATFWGLARALTNVQTWAQLRALLGKSTKSCPGPKSIPKNGTASCKKENTSLVSAIGDHRNVDLVVGDIYGTAGNDDLPANLAPDTVAASFGKLSARSAGYKINREVFPKHGTIPVLKTSSNKSKRSKNALSNTRSQKIEIQSVDLLQSLLMLMAYNITQLAYLYAKREGLKNIIVTGGFVKENPIVWAHMTRALQFWSNGTMRPHFVHRTQYVGALGALLHRPK